MGLLYPKTLKVRVTREKDARDRLKVIFQNARDESPGKPLTRIAVEVPRAPRTQHAPH